MSDTVVQDLAAEEPKVKVFGLFHTGWTEKKKARLLERLVTTLWRRGPMTTGQLASCVQLQVQNPLFEKAVAALVDWKIIEVKKRNWGIAYTAELIAAVTVLGKQVSIDVVCERQKKGLSAEGE